MDKKPRQPGLFGDLQPEEETARSATVDTVPLSPELEAVARALPSNIHLGTSSWSFPGWQGIVYDRRATKAKLARHGLEAYSRHALLRAVGIDRTFYAPVPSETFAAYAAAVPDDFLFLVKASAESTSPYRRDAVGKPIGKNPMYLDPGWATDAVVRPFTEGTGDKGGALVFQFPPQGDRVRGDPSRFADRLAEFFSRLPRGPAYAVELRDRELFGAEYLAALRESGVGHCHNAHPRMPPIGEQARLAADLTAGPLVVRWMLHGGLDYSGAIERYEPFDRLVDEDLDTRASLTSICLEETFRGRVVVIVANNKAEGSAPLTVFRLAEEIVRARRESGSD